MTEPGLDEHDGMNGQKMKVLVHDYGGHAFTGQLASQLAELGHEVLYVWFAGFPGPKGRWAGANAEDGRLSTQAIGIASPFDKDNLLRRGLQQLDYARRLGRFVGRERPDSIISANAPIEVQQSLLRTSRRIGASFVYWQQDIHSEAISNVLGQRNAALGWVAGAYYRVIERRIIHGSDNVVTIAPSFRRWLGEGAERMAAKHVRLIENWAPLEDIPLMERDNGWAVEHMRPGRRRIVYAGTLARKHDPRVLLELARRVDADVWVFSEGRAARELSDRAALEGPTNLFVRPWLSPADLPKALASADLLCAIVEARAGTYSVPSKVLTYLAAGRPIIGSLPHDNLASETVRRAGAGLISRPGDLQTLVADANLLLGDAALRTRMGQNGRQYAERVFDIEKISDKFLAVLRGARDRSAPAIRRSIQLIAPTD
jgi:colanic acid biosynthesis glycosyl transferase WcaI